MKLRKNSSKRKIAVALHSVPSFELLYDSIEDPNDQMIISYANQLIGTKTFGDATYYVVKNNLGADPDTTGHEYIAITSEEAHDLARQYIDENMGKFNTDWLAFQLNVSYKDIEKIKELYHDHELVRDELWYFAGNEKWEDMISAAISHHGVAHFLLTYDGNEYGPIYVGDMELYLYRVG